MLNRDREWQELTALWQSDRLELAIVLGRRRVGKSYVLAPFARAVEGLYYQATRRSEAEQLESLTRLLGERFDDPALRHGSPIARWDALFRYLADRVKGKPFLLVLDEFPYLEAAAPGLSTVLQALLDHELASTRLKLILSGSHLSAMRRLEGADQPLYGRRTRRIEFSPFGCAEASLFTPGYSAREALQTYGVFGGLPGHLALVDPDVNLATNVQRQILDPGARLFDEAQHVLDAFLAGAEVHYSILDSIARGDERWSAITGRVGATAGSLSRPMRWLGEMRIVERVVPITEPKPAKSKRALYRLADPYLRFWHRFVSPLQQAGLPANVSPARLWKRYIAPELDAYMGPIFEQACRQWLSACRALPFEPVRVGEWWSPDSRHQIDLVALSDDRRILVGECKWGHVDRHHVVSLGVAASHLLRELSFPETSPCRFLFTGQTCLDPPVRKQLESTGVRVFTASDLLAGAGPSASRRRR